ncbi:hypothetical protein RRG08_020257 [Elysia crispata]|uniref:Uncharacterized protein n=1 Tax=Elysia crispata TaxID=231223 RepID=A0AAE1B262_9GAST|nr:hypothetical protein RRG08_020257 [Elysia crispata]
MINKCHPRVKLSGVDAQSQYVLKARLQWKTLDVRVLSDTNKRNSKHCCVDLKSAENDSGVSRLFERLSSMVSGSRGAVPGKVRRIASFILLYSVMMGRGEAWLRDPENEVEHFGHESWFERSEILIIKGEIFLAIFTMLIVQVMVKIETKKALYSTGRSWQTGVHSTSSQARRGCGYQQHFTGAGTFMPANSTYLIKVFCGALRSPVRHRTNELPFSTWTAPFPGIWLRHDPTVYRSARKTHCTC